MTGVAVLTVWLAALPAPAQDSSLVVQFDAAVRQWKQAAKDALLAKQQFLICEQHEAAEIEARWTRAIGFGREQFQAAIGLATRVIEESPQQLTADMAALFGAAIESSYESGNYEEAGALCDKVLSSQIEAPPSILGHRVLISFALNEFQLCRQQLDELKSLGLPLTSQLESIDQHVDKLQEWWEREQLLRAAEAERDDLPRVRLVCDVEADNEVIIELFEDSAPRNVANFIELVKSGFFDGLTFHQVVTHVAARSGSPAGDGNDEPRYFVQGEMNAPQARHSFRGAVAMASLREQNLHGTEFFIALSPSIDNSVKATVIGRVVSGMDVISKLNLTHVSNAEKQSFEPVQGVPPSTIVKAEVIRDRGHAYSAEKIVNPSGG